MSAGGSCSSLRQSSPWATTRARERSFQLLELAAAVELVRASPPDQHTRRRAEPSGCLVRLRLPRCGWCGGSVTWVGGL